MASDIVERLRSEAEAAKARPGECWVSRAAAEDAAAEIERLRAVVASMDDTIESLSAEIERLRDSEGVAKGAERE